MATKRLPRPRDPVQLGRLVVFAGSGQVVDTVEGGKDAEASAMGRRGGAAHAHGLTPKWRAKVAKTTPPRWWARNQAGKIFTAAARI